MNWPVLIFITSFSGIDEYPEPTTNGLLSADMAQGTGMEGIEEPNKNDDVEGWVEADSGATNIKQRWCPDNSRGG